MSLYIPESAKKTYAVTTGTGNALIAAIAMEYADLSAGLRITIKTHKATTGPVTVDVGYGPISIKKPNGGNPSLATGGVYSLVYDGTVFQLQGEGGEYGTAVASDVTAGKTIGTESGIVTGTLNDLRGKDVTFQGFGLDGTAVLPAQPTDVGIFDELTNFRISDPDLTALNIKAGVNIFGRTGTFTSDATATRDDIIEGKTAYVNGMKVEGQCWDLRDRSTGLYMQAHVDSPGTLELYAPISGNFAINVGSLFYLYDENFIASNVLSGKNILGLDGSATSDANAVAADIATGKTAYVNGQKIVGTRPATGRSKSATGTAYPGETGAFTVPTSPYAVTLRRANIVAPFPIAYAKVSFVNFETVFMSNALTGSGNMCYVRDTANATGTLYTGGISNGAVGPNAWQVTIPIANTSGGSTNDYTYRVMELI